MVSASFNLSLISFFSTMSSFFSVNSLILASFSASVLAFSASVFAFSLSILFLSLLSSDFLCCCSFFSSSSKVSILALFSAFLAKNWLYSAIFAVYRPPTLFNSFCKYPFSAFIVTTFHASFFFESDRYSVK